MNKTLFGLAVVLCAHLALAAEQLALPDGSMMTRHLPTTSTSKGDLLLLSGRDGSYRQQSVLPQLADSLSKLEWTSWLPPREAGDALPEDRFRAALQQMTTGATSQPPMKAIIAEDDAARFAIQQLIGGEVAAVVLLNAGAELNVDLVALPEALNGRIIEICAPKARNADACQQRREANLPQLNVHLVPAANAAFSHREAWVRNVVYGFLSRMQRQAAQK